MSPRSARGPTGGRALRGARVIAGPFSGGTLSGRRLVLGAMGWAANGAGAARATPEPWKAGAPEVVAGALGGLEAGAGGRQEVAGRGDRWSRL